MCACGECTCRCAVGWELVGKERFGKPRTIEVWALSTSCCSTSTGEHRGASAARRFLRLPVEELGYH